MLTALVPVSAQLKHSHVYATGGQAVFTYDKYLFIAAGWERKADKTNTFLPRAGLVFIADKGADDLDAWRRSYLGAEFGYTLRFSPRKKLTTGVSLTGAILKNLGNSGPSANFYFSFAPMIGTGEMMSRFEVRASLPLFFDAAAGIGGGYAITLSCRLQRRKPIPNAEIGLKRY
ncbi:MAG TPA: hypothetical protein VEC12_01990 [Bacteroidia bacterium]|nr:hypothetical protein [Bacteroidia bacterium]